MSLPIIDPVQASQNMNALGEGLPGIGGASAQSVYSDIANNTIEPTAELALLTGATVGAGSYLQISNAAIKALVVFSLGDRPASQQGASSVERFGRVSIVYV